MNWKYAIGGLAALIAGEIAYIAVKSDIGTSSVKAYFEDAPSKLKAEARLAVQHGLRDPASAQFTEETVIDDETVCGNVNAKNGFGGYSGKSGYFYQRAKGATIAKDDRDLEVNARCVDARLAFLKVQLAKLCRADTKELNNNPSCKAYR